MAWNSLSDDLRDPLRRSGSALNTALAIDSGVLNAIETPHEIALHPSLTSAVRL